MEIKNISLIVSTYNWLEALELCLDSILKQTKLPSEVIIADDGSNDRTAQLVRRFADRAPFPVWHEWHEDKGFRKTIILNKAILKSSGEYIVQIDGDVILDAHFVEDHVNMAEEGCFIRGTRAILSPQRTEIMLHNKRISVSTKFFLGLTQPANALHLPACVACLMTRKEFSGRRVKGCNMSFWKKDLIAVNGYDNTLEGWGHEDEELSWRLVNYGVQKKIVKFSAIAYHMYHKWVARDSESKHLTFLERVRRESLIHADSGLKELSDQS